jgi:hypothetical protein
MGFSRNISELEVMRATSEALSVSRPISEAQVSSPVSGSLDLLTPYLEYFGAFDPEKITFRPEQS